MNFKSFARIASDIKLETVGQKATPAAKFSIAVNRKVQGNSVADFHNCIAWGKMGEVISKYFHKGSRIVIEGEVQNNNYTDKNGAKHYGYVINVSGIDFVDTKTENEQITQAEPTQTEQAEPQTTESFVSIPDNLADEGLPF